MAAPRRDDYLIRAGKVMALASLFVVAFLFLWFGGRILLLLFMGLLVAIVLRTPTGYLNRRLGWPTWLAFTLVLIAILGGLVGFGFLVGPQLNAQITQLVERLPESLRQVQEILERNRWGAWLLGQLQRAGDGGGLPLGQITATAGSVTTTVAHLFLVLASGVFMAASPGTYRRGIVALVPPAHREKAWEVIDELGRTLKAWLVGQLLLMFIVGTVTGVGLWIIGVPLALALGFISGLLDFVPIAGPIIAFIPGVLMASTQGFSTVIWVVILYILVQQLEGNVLVPLVQQRAVDLPPVLTVAVVFLGGMLFGPLGVLVATPLLAVVFVLVKLLYIRDLLREEVTVPGIEGTTGPGEPIVAEDDLPEAEDV